MPASDSPRTAPVIQFFYAIGSRYSYLASCKLEQLAREHGARIEWLPINSVRLLEERGYSPFAHTDVVKGQYSESYREQDAQRWAKLYGVPFQEPRGRLQLDSELLALAATAGKLLSKPAELSKALFSAVFRGQTKRLDAAECTRQATNIGLDAATFTHALGSEETATALDETMLRAHVAGVFGVPTFIVNGEQFWGNDRLLLLSSYLAQTV